MNIFPLLALVALALGSTGTLVSNLQKLLLRLGVGDLPEGETTGQWYGPVTGRLVEKLQHELGLTPAVPGEMDEVTAEAVNDLAFRREIFNSVEGSVAYADGEPARRVSIQVWDADNMPGMPCTEISTDDDGRYRAFYDPRFYLMERPGVIVQVETVAVVVMARDEEGSKAVSEIFREPERRLNVDLNLPAVNERLLHIRGDVVDESGTAMAGIGVEVIDREIGTDRQSLGTRVTNREGSFELRYRPADYESGEGLVRHKAMPDIVFQLSRTEGGTALDFTIDRLPAGPNEESAGLGAVDPREQLLGIPVRADELVRLTVRNAQADAGPSEFEHLLRRLKPLTRLRALADFDEAGTQDISFAAREIDTGYDLIDAMVTAHRLAGTARQPAADRFDGRFPPATLYGLVRLLGTRDIRSLASRRSTELATALVEARKLNVIPDTDEDPDRTAAEVHAAAVNVALGSPGSDAESVDHVLGAVIEDTDLRRSLAVASVDFDGDADTFWSRVQDEHPDLAVPDIRFRLQLNNIVDGNAPLVEKIVQDLPAANSMRTLALELDDARLAGLIEESGALPSALLDGETEEAARARLNDDVRQLIGASQPTSVVARLARDWSRDEDAPVPASAARFLDRAVRESDFDLDASDIGDFADRHAAVLFADGTDAADRQKVIDAVSRVQRLYRISIGPDTVSALATGRTPSGRVFQGAADVARYSKSAFLANFAQEPAQVRSDLGKVHDRASAMLNAMSVLLVGQHQDLHDTMPRAARPPAQPEDEASTDGPQGGVPSWTDFFGSTEECECDECRSITGPAAYLVDLFEYLDKRCDPDERGITPLDHLIGHATKKLRDGLPVSGLRPDLAHIKLTCENVNTTIPTVDLINEILESIVAFGQTTPLVTGPDGTPVEPHVLHPNESSPGVTGRELSAAPEHVLEGAYRALSEAVYPIGLPYNRLLATARVYFAQSGTSRADLLELFGPEASSLAVAADRLGLLARDVEILTGRTLNGEPPNDPVATETLFGFEKGAPGWPDALSTSYTALRALDVSFVELVELLRTHMVGGMVPEAGDPGTAAHLLIDVSQLAALRTSGYAVEPNSAVEEALFRGGITAADVQKFVDGFGELLSSTIVLDPPLSCDPGRIKLRHLDDSPMDKDEWLRMHRMVRLTRRMGISLTDLDIVLAAVAGRDAQQAGFNASVLIRVAGLAQLRKRLGLSWPEAAALVADIPAYGTGNLYDELFIRSGLARTHPWFRRGADGSVLATAAPFEEVLPALASALDSSETELRLVAACLNLTDLRLPEVSRLNRLRRLAGALGISLPECAVLSEILGDPENAAGPGHPLSDPDGEPDVVVNFLDRSQLLVSAGFSAGVLALLTGTTFPGDTPGRPEREFAAILQALAAAAVAADEKDRLAAAEEAARKDSGVPFTEDEQQTRTNAAARARCQSTIDILAQTLATAPGLLERLFDARPQLGLLSHTIDPGETAQALNLLAGCGRVSVMVATAGLPLPQLDAVLMACKHTPDGSKKPDDAVVTVFDGIHAPTILRVAEDVSFFKSLAGQTRRPQRLADAITEIAAATAEHLPKSAAAAVAAWLNMDPDQVDTVLQLGLPQTVQQEAVRRPLAALDRIRQCLLACGRLSQPADRVRALLAEQLGTEELTALVKGVSAGYPVSAWPEVSRQLADPIRESSRNALVGYLVHQKRLKNADDLFNIYLVDMQISSFALTSRIRQAIFAVHTYVQRCLLGQVHGVSPAQINTDEWDSMQSQAVWQARAEATFRPEWFLAWRDNKTRLFKETEKFLRQSDVTPASAGQAYDQYLAGLGEIASLEVCGTFLQTVFTGKDQGRFQSVLHVAGRTRSSVPRKYFYRRLNQYRNYREWTDWEPVNVEIQGVEQDRPGLRNAKDFFADLPEPGVHLLPVIWRDQLHLFWPTFVRKVEGKDAPADINANSPTIKASFSRPYWEIKLCWTRRDTAGWSSKEQSTALAETWWLNDSKGTPILFKVMPSPQLPNPADLVLQAYLEPNQLAIIVGQRQPDGSVKGRIEFSFARAASEVKSGPVRHHPDGDHPALSAGKGLTGSYQGLRAAGSLRVVADAQNPQGDLLCTPSSPIRILPLNQGFGAPLQAPYFLDLGDSSYFVSSEPSTSTMVKAASKPATPLIMPQFKPDLIVQSAAAAQTAKPLGTWIDQHAAATAAAAVSALQSISGNGTMNSIFDRSQRLNLADRISDTVNDRLKPGTFHIWPGWTWVTVPSIHLRVYPFSHPFVDRFRAALRSEGLDALLSPAMQQLTLPAAATFAARCLPNTDRMTVPDVEGIDFAADAPFGTENWELFVFLPSLIGTLLADNRQYSAAMKALATIYDPLGGWQRPEEAWRFLPLRNAKAMRLDQLLATLNLPVGHPERVAFEAQIEAMRLYPFQPHRTARLRPLAYKKWAVIQAIKLQLAISREYHSQFPNPEAFNRAFQPALLASAMLGPRPEVIHARVSMAPRSYAELRPDLDSLGNVMLTAESKLAPAASAALGSERAATGSESVGTSGLVQRGAISYFGIPSDRKLLELWDEVEDRLFKLRNSMDLNGVQSQLPLFPPRIDPALLAEAMAGGVDLGAAMSDLIAPHPVQRFEFAHREAVDNAQWLIALGDALLATAGQQDEQEHVKTRADQEHLMADKILNIRQKQLDAAQSELLDVSIQREGFLEQWQHFRDLLGIPYMPQPSLSPSATGSTRACRPLNLVSATRASFDDLQVIPGVAAGLMAAFAPTPSLGAAIVATNENVNGITMAPGLMILAEEEQELQESFKAVKLTFDAALLDTLASILGVIPNFEAAAKPFGAGAAVHFGGQALAAVARAGAGNKNTAAGMHRFLAQVYAKQASVVLREREWVAGLNRAAASVREVDQRVLTMNLNIAYRRAELEAQETALLHAQEIENFLQDKFTNTELYKWKLERLRELFRRACDLAFESAAAANASYDAERGQDAPRRFITVRPPQNAREELLTGHSLMTCLQEMKHSFRAAESRGLHVIRRFSLREVDPWALFYLRENGEAEFTLPEVLFDIDHPGHYDRRIRNVRISVLCGTSPATGVTGTLTMTGSRRRRTPAGNLEEDVAGPESIALSTGRDDSGVFEDPAQAHLYRPFEGRGVVADLKLVLPKEFRKMNYREIADVAVTLEFFVKDAGEAYADDRGNRIKAALNALASPAGAPGAAGLYRLVSLRHDCTDSWAAFRAGKPLEATIIPEILPYLLRNASLPKLKDAVGFRLPTGQPVSDALVMTHQGTGPWTIAPTHSADFEDPSRIDDIVLLLRFEL